MEKLRNLTSRLPTFSYSPSAKLSKAFKFDSDHNVLRRTQTAPSGNPFSDGPAFEEPSLSRVHMIIHLVTMFFTFLAVCTMGAVAGFQSKWFAISGGTAFTLFLLLVSFLLSSFLLLVPIIYDRWDRLKRPAQFLRQTRSTFILHAFGTGVMLLSAFIVTISAWTEKGCKNVDNDPHASLGDAYKKGLSQWCTTKKASAVFDWLSFGACTALLVLTVLTFRRERHREPSFIPPSSPPANSGVSYSGILAADDERYNDKPESESYFPTYDNPPAEYGFTRPSEPTSARPSVGAYGDYGSAGMPLTPGVVRAEERSRTMQLAYNDPYAQIRASLQSAPASAVHIQPGQHLYSQRGLPDPPSYGGYR